MNTANPLAFVIGLLSALHCVGMCGGIAGALSLMPPAEKRAAWPGFLGFLLAFNSGRVLSYALAGALFGSLGGALPGTDHPWLHEVLRWLAALVMRQALVLAGGNKGRAARLLGLTRDTLLYRLKKYLIRA